MLNKNKIKLKDFFNEVLNIKDLKSFTLDEIDSSYFGRIITSIRIESMSNYKR